ncbi:unnamed protein product [Cylindrotheca closterium]|uniref:tRNA-uridine aminocarboxypropyltransferase n=1 Tax=Cylindrotheca closterium TaxID=2856 RepID=A0AAD2FXJ1_9STRA|nr:unnamed protein product [Cylindrotheca closterium]
MGRKSNLSSWLYLGIALAKFFLFLQPAVALTSGPKNAGRQTRTQQDLSQSGEKTPPSHLQVKIASSITKGERRKEERQSKTRNLCPGCDRPPVICVCDALPPEKLSTRTQLLVLQHPNEFRKKTFSTVPLMSLVLENVQVQRDYQFEVKGLQIVQECLDRGQRPLLLFPGDDAISLDGFGNLEDDESKQEANMVDMDANLIQTLQEIRKQDNLLIVMDGTWAEAKRMALGSEDLVNACQQVQFTAPASCLYDAIRKEPEGHCLSTLEACAQSLVLLEGARETATYLKGVLQHMVNIQLTMERNRQDDPRQKGKQLYERNKRRRRVEKTLFEKPKPQTLQDGAILRPLAVNDAKHIHYSLCHKSRTSLLRTTQDCLEEGLACFGIENKDGHLCAHIVRSRDGTLGMLHVETEYRRKGYGRLLVQEASKVLKELDKPCVCFIQKGDEAAESLFCGLGWIVSEQGGVKSGTPSAAKQRWVLPSSG